jgi:hypothetical protein
MPNSINQYLNSFKDCLRVDLAIKDSTARELYTHLEDKSQELKESGLSQEEADKVATQTLGSPELIARQIYKVYAQGSWQEAFLAALPHFMVALLFASYYWENTICLLSVLVVTVGITIYGWHRDKPIWLFPWLGYYLLPVIVTGILLVYLSKGWGWIVVLIYIPVALFALICIVRQTMKRDWLYASLMLAPLPVIFSWLLSLGTGSEFLMNNIGVAQVQTKVPWIVISFLALAGATAAFIRLTQRWCKIVALLTPPIVILVSITLASRGNIDLWGWLILLSSLLAFASPAWIQASSHHA